MSARHKIIPDGVDVPLKIIQSINQSHQIMCTKKRS